MKNCQKSTINFKRHGAMETRNKVRYNEELKKAEGSKKKS
jgi:hypothetical protein